VIKALQAGRSRVREHMRSINVFNLPNPSGLTLVGFTQPLTEIVTRGRKIIVLRSRARPVSRADNLAAISEPTAGRSRVREHKP
jgi:hypothetical protein